MVSPRKNFCWNNNMVLLQVKLNYFTRMD
jgi:hypothetical protein